MWDNPTKIMFQDDAIINPAYLRNAKFYPLIPKGFWPKSAFEGSY